MTGIATVFKFQTVISGSYTTNSAGSETLAQRYRYGYDAAFNMTKRTNQNSGVTTYNVNNLNQNTSFFTSFDSNGNPISGNVNGGAVHFEFDDENRMTEVLSTNNWKYNYSYDARGRLRKRVHYTWGGSAWYEADQKWYLYDGMLAVQERDSANTPAVTYTRGIDMSGSIQGAGGIGGLLARSSSHASGSFTNHLFYHADGNGNITYLVKTNQTLGASYRYDPFGRTITSAGTYSGDNTYRFSSKEWQPSTELYYYGYRFYDPTTQRWLNRDPLGILDGKVNLRKLRISAQTERNLYTFVDNSPTLRIDTDGRVSISHLISQGLTLIGGGGKCCNNSGQGEWWLDDGVWKPLNPGACSGTFEDCDGFTCNGKFYKISTGSSAQCKCDGNGDWIPKIVPPFPDP